MPPGVCHIDSIHQVRAVLGETRARCRVRLRLQVAWRLPKQCRMSPDSRPALRSSARNAGSCAAAGTDQLPSASRAFGKIPSHRAARRIDALLPINPTFQIGMRGCCTGTTSIPSTRSSSHRSAAMKLERFAGPELFHQLKTFVHELRALLAVGFFANLRESRCRARRGQHRASRGHSKSCPA